VSTGFPELPPQAASSALTTVRTTARAIVERRLCRFATRHETLAMCASQTVS
jgi:hypothetical protein